VTGGVPGEWRIHFRRQFDLAELVEWDNLCREVQGLPVDAEEDVVSWSLEASGRYSTRSTYLALSQGASMTSFKDVWKTRVPPRIRVFLWQLIHGRLPSSDQVAKPWGHPMAYALYVGT
jgi:hypothetical protein